ncbi:hypothetical protein CI102_14475 [Trichoderma harzianum]|nr:hypothetical protein CI102_14475 [Trichoderma harzianum]
MGNALHVLAVINATPTTNCRWVISAVDCDCTHVSRIITCKVPCHYCTVLYSTRTAQLSAELTGFRTDCRLNTAQLGLQRYGHGRIAPSPVLISVQCKYGEQK